ncbi:MAG: LamG-like jellyroll fold domain-containing protein [Caldilineaceae bacterium]
MRAQGGLDPNDGDWDSDDDGLADAYELQQRQLGVPVSPILIDTDNDGLTDRQELRIGTNPGIADSDNDGLWDGAEVRHRRYDTNTGAVTSDFVGGWEVTVGGAMTVTVHVDSNPLLADSDGDGIDDLAEKQLAENPDPAQRVDELQRPYHPLLFNTPPVAIYSAINDADGFVGPGQSVIYTNTVIANTALAPSVLDVNPSAAYIGFVTPQTLAFDPLTFSNTQTVTVASQLTIAMPPTSRGAAISSTVRARLQSGSGPEWVMDPIAMGAPLSGFTYAAIAPAVAAASGDRTDEYMVSALTVDPSSAQGQGDIWNYAIPSGTGGTIEDDTYAGINDFASLRGPSAPDIACNDEGSCLVVWDEVDNCNTVTFNSIRVIRTRFSFDTWSYRNLTPLILTQPLNEPLVRSWPASLPSLAVGDSRGPNSDGFPVTLTFCGSVQLSLYDQWLLESIEQKTFLPTSYLDGEVTFSQPYKETCNLVCFVDYTTVVVNMTIPSKEYHTITGKLIHPDGSEMSLVMPQTGYAGSGRRFRPVAATDGRNFVIASELAIDAATDTTQVMAQQFTAEGVFTGSQFTSAPTARAGSLLDTPVTGMDMVWGGDRYYLAQQFDNNGEVYLYELNSSGEFTNTQFIDQSGPFNQGRVDLAYHPLAQRLFLSYRKMYPTEFFGSYRTAPVSRLFAQDYTVIQANDAFTNVVNLEVTYQPETKGWLLGTTKNNEGVTVQPLTAAGQSQLEPRLGFDQIAAARFQEMDLACPAIDASPVVDLRFEALPGATTFVDSAGNGFDLTGPVGTLPTAGLAGATDRNGLAAGMPASDHAVRFDGIDDSLTLPRPVHSDLSVAFWLNTTQANSTILAAGDLAADGYAIQLVNGTPRFVAPGKSVDTTTAINDGRWHWIVVSRNDTGAAAIYIDGAVAATDTIIMALDSTDTWTIGNGSYAGLLDELKIYDATLTATTVQAIYDRTIQSYCVAATTGQDMYHSQVDWAKIIIRRPDYRGGKVTASGGISFTIDVDTPTVSLDSFQDGQYIRTTADAPQIHVIGGNASDVTSGVAGVEVAVNGLYQPASGAEAWAYQWPVSEGVYTLQSRAVDAVGNMGDPSPPITVIADATAPAITFDAPGGTVVPTRSSDGRWSFSLSGTVADPAIGGRPGSGLRSDAFEIMVEGASGTLANADWQTVPVAGAAWQHTYVLGSAVIDPIGTYTITAHAEDTIGNEITQQLGVITLDSVGPEMTFALGTEAQQLISETQQIGGLVSEVETGASPVAKLEAAFVPVNQLIPLVDAQLHLRFDERAGAVYYGDSSGFANNAICATMPVCPTAGATGRRATALQFNGQALVSVADQTALNVGADDNFSIQSWINSANGNATILHKGDLQRGWTLALDGAGRAQFSLTNERGTVAVAGGADLRDNQWHQLAATVDRKLGLARLYVDGQLVGEQMVSGSFGSQSEIWIGGKSGLPTTAFAGLIDEVVLVAHAWNQSEVADLLVAVDQVWHAATIAPSPSTVASAATRGLAPKAIAGSEAWSLDVPAGLEGTYQIELQSHDAVGNSSQNPNVWRGVIDTLAPRLVITGTATGATYLDPRDDQRRYAVHYTCVAHDEHLDEASFVCPGSEQRPAVRTFDDDETLHQHFPDWTVRTGLVLSYTVWQTNTVPNATVAACDVFGHCASDTAQGVAVPPLLDNMPFSVVISPTAGAYVASTGRLSVTVAAEAANGLREIELKLDGNLVDRTNYDQAANLTSVIYDVTIDGGNEGEHLLETTATDWLGNTQRTFFPTRFLLDTALPIATLRVSTAPISSTYGAGSAIKFFSGQAADTLCLAAVQVQVGDQPYMDVAFADGSWSAAVPTNGPSGELLSVTVHALDCAGQITAFSQAVTTTVTADIPPDTTITAGPVGVLTEAQATLLFTSTVGTNPLAGFRCKLDNEPFAPCTSPYTVSNLSELTHTLTVWAIDETGLEDPTPAEQHFFVDAIPLQVSIDSGPTDPTASRTVTFTFRGESGVTGYRCALVHGTEVATLDDCTSPAHYHGLQSGQYGFQVQGHNAVNASGQIASYSFGVTNAAPVATSQVITMSEDLTTTITLTATDANADSLSYAVARGPQHGSVIPLTGTGEQLVYTPSANFNGVDNFTYVANDSEVNSALMTVTVKLLPVNDAPFAASQVVTLTEDTPMSVTLSGSDVDGDSLRYRVVTTPTHGTRVVLHPICFTRRARCTTVVIASPLSPTTGRSTHRSPPSRITVTAANDTPVVTDQSVRGRRHRRSLSPSAAATPTAIACVIVWS